MNNASTAGMTPEDKRALLAKLMQEKAQAPKKHPLSFAQKRLWFLDQMEPDTPFYNIGWNLELHGPLDPSAWEQSLLAIVRRHDTLRTTFTEENGQALQVVAPSAKAALAVPLIDLSGMEAGEQEREVLRLMHADVQRPFDLREGPLFRATLVRLAPDHHLSLITLHHIIADGWSIGVFARELQEGYAARIAGEPADRKALHIQYADYAKWQAERLNGDALQEQITYWKEKLDGAPALLELPTDHPRPAKLQYRGAYESVPIAPDLFERLREIGRRENASLYMVLLTAFQALLMRWTGQEDVLVGTPSAGRERSETQDLIGLFVNTQVIRPSLEGALPFREALRRVRETVLEAARHAEVPFEKVVEELQPERALNVNPLFQVMFSYFEFGESEVEAGPLRWKPIDEENPIAKFDLTLYVEGFGNEYRARFEYDIDLFEGDTIGRLAAHFLTLLHGIAANPEERLSRLPLLSEAERRQLLIEWNDTDADYPRTSISEAFERQVDTTPGAVAVTFGDLSMTYAELDAAANRLARHLQQQGVEAGDFVGLCLERSFELIVSLLAIVKTGAAYVPLDPSYPAERLVSMLEDAQVTVLLGTRELLEQLPATDALLVRLDEESEAVAAQSAERLALDISPNACAYVNFTSGSTGRPKGVLTPHRGVLRLVKANEYATFSEDEVFLHFAPISFDATTLEVWGSLLNGARVALYPNEQVSLEGIGEAIRRHGVTFLWLTAGLFHQMAEHRPEDLLPLRQLLSGGDALSVPHVRKILSQLQPGSRLVNGYGPTETTTFAVCHVMTSEEALGLGTTVPIGRPINNTKVYVLDPEGQPVPIGVTGELFIGGDGLALGYLNRPELTARSFVPNPFTENAGATLYKTGDLVRWRADGRLEFVGRTDHQVKIRGFRIELGEIENVLLQHAHVADAVAIVREDVPGDKRIAAYAVAKSEAGDISGRDLLEFLQGRLPKYMMPYAVTVLDHMPLTSNGKVDRKALPQPEIISQTVEQVAPRDALEVVLAQVFASLLGLDRVGIHDDFFACGGHSLLATQVTAQLRQMLRMEVPLRLLFEHPSVAGLASALTADPAQKQNVEKIASVLLRMMQMSEEEVAAAVQHGGHADRVALFDELLNEEGVDAEAGRIARRDSAGPAALSFAQQRLWFLSQLGSNDASYNMPMLVRLSGTLDDSALEESFNRLIARHETLRTTIRLVDGEPVQEIATEARIDLQRYEALGAEVEVQRTVIEEAGRPFDLSQGPLLRVILLATGGKGETGEDEHLLLINLHHIIADGWSLNLLLEDLAAIYDALVAGQAPALSPLPIQYADYALWQRDLLQGETLQQELDYWTSRLADAPTVLELPTDRPRPPVQSYAGANVTSWLDADLSRRLQELAREEQATLFMLLLGAYKVLLSRYTGQEDILVGTPIAGREDSDTERLIGLFVNTLVMRTNLQGNPSFRDVIARVKEGALEAYSHQSVPFEKVVEALNVRRDTSYHPIFQLWFGYQAAPLSKPEAGGLRFESDVVPNATSKFDLSLDILSTEQGLQLSIQYSTELFEQATIVRLLSHFERLLAEIGANPDAPVAAMHLLGDEERRQLLVDWNQTDVEFPRDATLHTLFEQQVRRTPLAIACIDGELRLTYEQLNARANRLARRLQQMGVTTESLVGICMKRSADMLTAMLAVFKAGGAYVPLDPAYPKERLRVILEDSEVAVVVTQERLLDVLPEHDAQLLVLDAEKEQASIDALPADDLQEKIAPSQTAYLIYTSGSTGRPKGVVIEHHNAVSLLTWAQQEFPAEHLAGVLAATSICFDLSVYELFLPLSMGGKVIMAENVLHVPQLPAKDEITLINTVPSAIQELLRMNGVPSSVRIVNLAGEPLRKLLVDRLYDVPTIERVYNLYGPSETTTYSTFALLERGDEAAPTIGRPVGNTRLYVLDPLQEPVPTGVPGELYIGGEGVSRGYLRRPELTEEKYLPDPFAGKPDARMYRTGDLVRYLPDGRLEFLGRIDHQVKVRGFRIELGEVETMLTRHASVRESHVLVSEQNGDKRLLAYLVFQPGETLSASDLRGYLKERLPDYMVPSSFVVLDALPLLPNGKVDRAALLSLESQSVEIGTQYVAPQNEAERLLCTIWQEVLGVERVGLHDNFFDLGGHSLLLMRVHQLIQARIGGGLDVIDLFRYPTVSLLAKALTSQDETPAFAGAGAETQQRAENKRAAMNRRKQLSQKRGN
jgi:amino acid adenylation domain-containing protein